MNRLTSKMIASLVEEWNQRSGIILNAYALFNAVTEFASHPPTNRHIHRDRHSLQRLVGVWMNSFSRECRQPGFALREYLKKLANEDGPSAVRPGASEVRNRF
jgi:hypothetical protein